MDKNTNNRHISSFIGQQYSDWLLNVHVFSANDYEVIDKLLIDSLVYSSIKQLEESCMSEEFLYFRVGFITIHFGRRGIDITVFHYGKWTDTFEVFSCSWYTYGRDLEGFELLDSREPVFSKYELSIIIDELKTISRFKTVEDSISLDSFRNWFCSVNRSFQYI